MHEMPCETLLQNESTVVPAQVTTPIPVTTTSRRPRRFMSISGLENEVNDVVDLPNIRKFECAFVDSDLKTVLEHRYELERVE